MNPFVLISLVGIFVGPIVTWLIAVRRLSGRITDSAATDLWEESRSIRQDLEKRNEYLRTIIDRCEGRIVNLGERIDILEAKNDRLYLENGNLKRMIEEHEKTISELRDQVHDLSSENKSLRADNVKLRSRVLELENGRSPSN